MSVLDLHETGMPERVVAGITAVPPPACPTPMAPHRARRAFVVRLAVAAALTALAYAGQYAEILADALAGSRTAFLVVVPVLLVLIATSYRTPPRGVGDAESDWIIAALAGAAGFTAIHLVGERMPSLSALWRLPMLGVAVWFACLLVIMFGIRHVLRMWPLWLFAASTLTPLPYLVTVATFGGSQTAAALVAAALGAVAVYLAGRLAPLPWQLGTALGCAVISTGFVFSGVPGNLLLKVVVVGAVLPVAACAALRLTERTGEERLVRGYPRLSPVTLAVLATVSAALFLLHPPAPAANAVPVAHPDWMQRSQLGAPEDYDFVNRYLGEGATLHRYPVAPVAGMPVAVVDVMSSPDLAVLNDYPDAVWYPTKRPVEYRPAGLNGLSDLDSYRADVIHTDASTAIDNASRHWYAVTWIWHAANSFQRVTVVVNQDAASHRQPPPPTPPTLMNSAVEPALWIARQQAITVGAVDPLVIRRATDVVELLMTSAAQDKGDPEALTGA